MGLAVIVLLSMLAGSLVLASPAQAATSCDGFDGWSVESESSDSVVNTGLVANLDVTQGESYYILERESKTILPDEWETVATVSGNSDDQADVFIDRSTLTERSSLDGSADLYVSYVTTGTLVCGDPREEGSEFSIGSDTSHVMLDIPGTVTTEESTTVTVGGWSTKSSFDLSMMESDPVFNDEYTSVTVYPDPSDQGVFQREITFTPGTHADSGQADVFAEGGGVTNLGGAYSIDVVEADHPPTAAFTFEDSNPNPGDQIDVDASASTDDNGIQEYRWDVTNDGSFEGTWDNPTGWVEAVTPGPQEVRLRVADASGQTDTVTKTISVNHQPTAEFDVSSRNPTAPIDGSTSVTIDGRDSSDHSGDSDGFVPDSNYEWTVRDPSGSDRVVFEGSPGPIDVDELTAGTWEIELTVTDNHGGTDTTSKEVTVTEEDTERPIAAAGSDRTVLVGESIPLDGSGSNDNVGIVDYDWDVDGDGNYEENGPSVTHSYGQPGQYEVTLRVFDGAGNSDTNTMTVTVEDRSSPTADAGSGRTVGVDGSLTLDGSGSTDNVGVKSYEWDVDGDGNYEKSGHSVTHSYSGPGTYEVTLRVADGAGNTATDTVTATVEDRSYPAADAGPDRTVGVGQSATLDGSGSNDNVGIESHEWDVDGDGDYEQSGQSVTHSYSGPGTYEVTLRVTDGSGNSDTSTVAVSVEDRRSPTADAGSDRTVSVAGSLTLAGSGSTDNVGVESHEWDVEGDGNYEKSGHSVTHSYSGPGTYEVTLRVADGAGNTATDTMTATVEDRSDPAADAGPDRTVGVEESVEFDGGDSTDNVGVESYEWDVDGDGDYEQSGQSVTHSYSGSGTYEVTLRVTDGAGNAAVDSTSVTVKRDESNDPPVADAGADRTVVGGDTVALNASGSTDPDGDVLDYEWSQLAGPDVSFDDAAAETSFVAPTVDTDTSLEFRLVVDDGNDTASDDVTVTVENATDPSPFRASISYSPTEPTVDEVTTFDGSGSTAPGGEIVAFDWDLDGDGEFERTGETVDATFDAAGSREVTLRVADENGNADTNTTTIEVTDPEQPDPPVADLTVASASPDVGEIVAFDANGSTAPDGEIVSFEWDLYGNGTVDETGETVQRSFGAAGTYEVALTVTDDNDNSDEATTSLAVGDVPLADTGENRSVDASATVELNASGSTHSSGETLAYEWEQVDGPSVELSENDSATPTFTAPDVDEASELAFEVVVTDDDGDSARDRVYVTVIPSTDEGEDDSGGTIGGVGGSGPALGAPVSADLQVAEVDAPASITTDETLTVDTTIRNDGDGAGSQRVTLAVAGNVVDSTELELSGGDTGTVTLTGNASSDLGTSFSATVASADDESTTSVTVENESTGGESGDGDEPASGRDEPAQESQDDDGEDGDPEDEPGGVRLPGFGVGTALVALLGAGLLAARRQY